MLKGISDTFDAKLDPNSGKFHVLKREEDAWISFFYGAHNKTLLPQITDCGPGCLIESWILGHRYDVKAFQDVIMCELLYMMSAIDIRTWFARRALEGTRLGSALR